jgi:hypothetical protein
MNYKYSLMSGFKKWQTLANCGKMANVGELNGYHGKQDVKSKLMMRITLKHL